MKHSHCLVCVAKNCDWFRDIMPLSHLNRASLVLEIASSLRKQNLAAKSTKLIQIIDCPHCFISLFGFQELIVNNQSVSKSERHVIASCIIRVLKVNDTLTKETSDAVFRSYGFIFVGSCDSLFL